MPFKYEYGMTHEACVWIRQTKKTIRMLRTKMFLNPNDGYDPTYIRDNEQVLSLELYMKRIKIAKSMDVDEYDRLHPTNNSYGLDYIPSI